MAPISIRVNPDVDAQTHPYISTGLKENKFGIAIDDALAVYQQAASLPNLQVIGVDCHIGSQLTSVSPFVDALERVLALIDALAEQGIHIKHLDIGGGLGICYRDEKPPTPAEYAKAMQALLKERDLEIMLEPGRAIAGNAGVLLTKVEYIKASEAKNFAIVDAAMNDLLRPALYQSWMAIEAVKPRQDEAEQDFDIVGPVCETGDFLGKDRSLAIQSGDLLAIRSAGAYGFTMSSNYNRVRGPLKLWSMEQICMWRDNASRLKAYMQVSRYCRINPMLKFSKMHGLGNDFVVIDAINQSVQLTTEQIRFMADRHIGIGCDQLLLVENSDLKDVDFRYRIFNADGGEVSQCGNGARCFARYVRDNGLTTKDSIAVETASG